MATVRFKLEVVGHGKDLNQALYNATRNRHESEWHIAIEGKPEIECEECGRRVKDFLDLVNGEYCTECQKSH